MLNMIHAIKIEIVDSYELTGMVLLEPGKCWIKNHPSFEKICVRGLVGAKTEDEYENHQKVYTTTATFLTPDITVRRWHHKCFRLTSADGSQYIIGTSFRPFPIIKEEQTFPEKESDSTLKKVTIKWTSPYPILQLQK